MISFQGRTVVITGGASGIGKATASLFAQLGADLVVGDLDQAKLPGLQTELQDLGANAVTLPCDVEDEGSLRALLEEATRTFGRLDVVFGNAGILKTQPLQSFTSSLFQKHLDVNLKSNFELARLSSPLLEDDGSIVFNASLGGIRGQKGSEGYNASKGGLVNLTRSLADELAPRIRVNCICPGWIDTAFNDPFWRLAGESAKPRILEGVPMGRQGKPQEVASVVAFLASDMASYITGHALIVDGGSSIS